MYNFGEQPRPLVLGVPAVSTGERDQEPSENTEEIPAEQEPTKIVPPEHDEVIWAWKVRIASYFLPPIHNISFVEQPELETTRRTFFL